MRFEALAHFEGVLPDLAEGVSTRALIEPQSEPSWRGRVAFGPKAHRDHVPVVDLGPLSGLRSNEQQLHIWSFANPLAGRIGKHR